MLPTQPPTDEQKLELVVRNAAYKALELVLAARLLPPQNRTAPNRRSSLQPAAPTTHAPPTAPWRTRQTDRWFNLETDEVPALRAELEAWNPRAAVTLQLDLYVEAAEHPLVADAAGVASKGSSSSTDGGAVLLERWRLRYEPASEVPRNIQWRSFYKSFMVLLRSLSAYLRLMPAFRFASAFACLLEAPLLCFRLSDASALSSLDFDYSETAPPLTHFFVPPDDRHGRLFIEVMYRPAALYGRPPPPPPSLSCALEGHLIQDYVPTKGASVASAAAAVAANVEDPMLGGANPAAQEVSTPSPPTRPEEPRAASLDHDAAEEAPRRDDAPGHHSDGSSTGCVADSADAPRAVPDAPNGSASCACSPGALAAAATAAATSTATPAVAASSDYRPPPQQPSAEVDRRRLERRSYARAASDLPFQFEEELAGGTSASSSALGRSAQQQGSFAFDTEQHEADLGSFVDDVSHAPSLHLFSRAPRHSAGGRSSGSAELAPATPLNRSVDDFSDQLDVLRQFHESSVAPSAHALASSPTIALPHGGSRSGRMSPLGAASTFGSSPLGSATSAKLFGGPPIDAPFLHSPSTSPLLSGGSDTLSSPRPSPPMMPLVVGMMAPPRASTSVLNSPAGSHGATGGATVLYSRGSSRGSSVAASSPPTEAFPAAQLLACRFAASAAAPSADTATDSMPFPKLAGSTRAGDSTEELARSPPPEDLFPLARDSN